MATRTITGTILEPDGTVWASGTVKFDLVTKFATATAAAVNQTSISTTTDVNGDFSVALEVPASDAWEWRCTLPDGNQFNFNLAAGSATTLHALLADANLGATVSASAIATAISDKADKTVPAATNNIALLGADGNLVDSGLGTGDIGGGVTDHGALTGLADDDHTQYLRADGTRALAGAMDMGSQALTNVNIDSGTIGANAIGDLATTSQIVTDHGALTGLGDNDHPQYALLNAVNTFLRGQLVDGAADEIQLRVQGHSTQTANILTIETSAGTVVVSISNAGNIDVQSITIAGDTSSGFNRPAANRVDSLNHFGVGGTLFYVNNAQAMRRNSNVLALGAGFAQIGIGINSSLLGDLHVRQDSTTGATPPLALEQLDVSEDFIRFIGSAAVGNVTQSIVNVADVSTATIAGYVKVYVQDDGNQITDQAYYMPVYTLT